jgi:hypothetical protein
MRISSHKKRVALHSLWGIGFAALMVCQAYYAKYMAAVAWMLYFMLGFVLDRCTRERLGHERAE